MTKNIEFKSNIRQIGNKDNPSYAIPIKKHLVDEHKLKDVTKIDIEIKIKK